jgi:hypothetical protein
MSILIWKDEKQNGPYSIEEIKQHLDAGKFSTDDLAWTEGQADWIPLCQMIPAEPVSSPAPPRHSRTQQTTSAVPSGGAPKTFSESIVEKAAIAARLTQKQANKKKLELVDLKQADYQIGKKAYEKKSAIEHFQDIRRQITETIQQIEDLRDVEESAAVSLSDKAKAAASATAKAAKVEALNLKQKSLITELGTKLRENSVEDPALIEELTRARGTAEALRQLDLEIHSLSKKTFTWAQRPLRIVAALIALTLVYASYNWANEIYRSWSVRRQAELIGQQAKAQSAQIVAEIAELRRQEAEAAKKEIQDREIERAQEKLADQKREITQQQETRAMKAQIEAEERQRKIEEAETQRKEAQEKIRREQAAELAKKQEKDHRSAFAVEKFSRISILPSVAFSASLRRLNVTTELRGQDTDTIQSLLQQRDYLKLVSVLRNRPYSEYPPVDEIAEALRELSDKRFSILLKTTFSESSDNELYLISFPDNDYTIVDCSGSWERHPDGLGFLHRWSLHDGQVIVVTGNYKTVEAPVHAFNDAARKQSNALKKKKELGEIDEVGYRSRMAELRKATYDETVKWALNK